MYVCRIIIRICVEIIIALEIKLNPNGIFKFHKKGFKNTYLLVYFTSRNKSILRQNAC